MEVEFTIFGLYDHIEKECNKASYCKLCSQQFDTVSDFHQHLKLTCPEVLISCTYCLQDLARKDFLNYETHDCMIYYLQRMSDFIS